MQDEINEKTIALYIKGVFSYGKKGNSKPRYPCIPYVKDR